MAGKSIDRQTLTGQLSSILRDSDTPQSVVNDMLASMIVTQADDMDALIAASRRQEGKLDDIIGRLKSFESTTKMMADVPARLDNLERYIHDNPSLVWLLRFRTRQTLAVIVLVFVLLSLMYVSDLRQPLLAALKLPVF